MLPLIPIAVAAAGTGVGAAIGSWLSSVVSKADTADAVADIAASNDLTTEQAQAIAAQNGVNLNSKFQKPGDGWFSDYSQTDNSQSTTTDNRTYQYVVTIDSPDATVTPTQTSQPTTTQTPTQTTTTNTGATGLDALWSGLGSGLGSLAPIALLLVGGFALYKVVSGKKGDA